MNSTMSFKDGVQKTNPTQQLIAFYTHMIDVFGGLADNGHDSVPTDAVTEDDISKETYRVTGTNSSESFLGATREGFRRAIDLLPDDVRGPVKAYLKKRVPPTRRREVASDILFGTDLFDEDN